MVVFFADVSDSMRKYKEILVTELTSAGCIVKEAPKNLQDFSEVLIQCDLAVHLLSDKDSKPDSHGKGFEESQVYLSVQRHLSQKLFAEFPENQFKIYAWYPKVKNGNFYKEDKVPSHLKKIEQLDEVELLRTGFEDFKFYLLRKIKSEQSEDLNEFYIKGANNRSIYFMYDVVDKFHADKYISQLTHRGFTLYTPSFDTDIITARQSHEKSLKKLDIAVVFAREASLNWINMKIVDLLKIPGLGRAREILETGIISTPEKLNQMNPMARKFKLISIEDGNVKEQLEELLNDI
jgi:hypothetical protein